MGLGPARVACYDGAVACRLFKSGSTPGPVAQLVAHLHGMQGVRGSSPLRSTKSGKPAERRVFLILWRVVRGLTAGLCRGRTIPRIVCSSPVTMVQQRGSAC